MEKNSINFIFDEKTDKFIFDVENLEFKMQIHGLDNTNLIATLDDVFIFEKEPSKNVAIFKEDQKINIELSQETFSEQKITIELFDVKDLVQNQETIQIFFSDDKFIRIQFLNCENLEVDNFKINVDFNKIDSKIEIFNFELFEIFNTGESDFNALTIPVKFVKAGEYGPQFSLSIHNASIFASEFIVNSSLRPVVSGVPVISTVPVPYSLSTPSQLAQFESGVGPDEIDISFRVGFSQTFESGSKFYLLTYFPNGEDTITTPEKTELSADKYAIIRFYKQDGIYSVDGFVYFSVYTDIVQQFSLPLQIDELPTTNEEFEADNELLDLF